MKPKDNIRRMDAGQLDDEIIRQAAQIVCSGGVVVFPTTGLYGLAADACNPVAVDKVFAVKQRPPDRPILILVSHIGEIRRLVQEIPPVAEQLMTAFWPGKLTLVFKAGSSLLSCLTAGTGNIGIRLPVHPVARSLVCAAGRPVTATSANLSGRPGCSRIMDIDATVLSAADLILDAGPLEGGAGSTIVDVTRYPPVVLREGAIPKSLIFSICSVHPQTG